MILRRLHPEPHAVIDADSDDGRAALDDLYAYQSGPWLRLNFIASVNGQAAGSDGTSESLTNRVDRRILGTIRRLGDLVLVGAGSIRTEGYFLPKTAPLAIVTNSGDLTGHRIPNDVAAGRVIVLCPSAAAPAVRSTLGASAASIIELAASSDGSRVDLAAAIDALHRLGYHRIVCEGGPTLAGQLVNAGVVDELCLSTSPQLSAHVMPVLPGLTSAHALQLTHLLADADGQLYARWRLAG